MTRMTHAARQPRRILATTPRWLAPAASAMLLLAALPAHAQLSGIMGHALETGPSGGISSGKDPDAKFRKPAPPPALPGSSRNGAAVAPAERQALDMDPTEALFDAVNRGDISAAREAISRGADLRARNILGLTALDLSVDVGRSDITFLLLSMRGAAPGGGPAKGATVAGGHPPPRGAAPAHVAAIPRPSAPVVARPAPERPRVIASDGGTPRPSAGFLGFGNP
jgi:hypothetical protein